MKLTIKQLRTIIESVVMELDEAEDMYGPGAVTEPRGFEMSKVSKTVNDVVKKIGALTAQSSKEDHKDVVDGIFDVDQLSKEASEKLMVAYLQKKKRVQGAWSHVPIRTVPKKN